MNVAPLTAASTTWANPTRAVDGTSSTYAGTSQSGASLTLSGISTGTARGAISQVRLEIESSQGVNLDDRIQLTMLGCSGGAFSPSEFRPGGAGSAFTTTASCPAGFTFTNLGNMGVKLATSSGLLTDSEYRVHEVRWLIALSNAAPLAAVPGAFEAPESTSVALDGTGSSDPDGDMLAYAWTQVSGDPVALQGTDQATATFMAPALATNADHMLAFRVTVADGQGHSSSADVDVTVKNTNTAPEARAGADQQAAVGAVVKLDGAASFDADGDALAYQWTQLSGPSVTLGTPSGVTSSFVAPAAGNVVIRLHVRDAVNAWSAPDDVTIAVAAPAPTMPPTTSPTPSGSTTTASTTTSSSPTPTPSPVPTPGPSAEPGPAPTTSASAPPTSVPASTSDTTQPSAPALPSPSFFAAPVPADEIVDDVASEAPIEAHCGLTLVAPSSADPLAVAFAQDCPLRFLVLQLPPATATSYTVNVRSQEALPPGFAPPPTEILWAGFLEIEIVDAEGAAVDPVWARVYVPIDDGWLERQCMMCLPEAAHLEGQNWTRLDASFDQSFPPNRTVLFEADAFSWFAVGATAETTSSTPDVSHAWWPWTLLGLVPLVALSIGVARIRRRRRQPSSPAVTAAAQAPIPVVAAAPDERVSRLLRELRTNRDLLQFVNNAAHDLSNPLTPINLQLHMLQRAAEAKEDEQQQKSLAMVRRNVDQLALLIQDLKEAAKLQAGKLRLTPEALDVGQLLRETAESYAEKAKLDGIQLSVEVEPKLGVSADSGRLVQVVTNFLTNALKFTPRGGKVRVAAGREGQDALVFIEDSGLGLTPDDQGRLFQAFSQVHDETQKKKGTGLGLFIAKGIIESHGGKIGCESEGPGRGSTFWFSLPLLNALATDAPSSTRLVVPSLVSVPAKPPR